MSRVNIRCLASGSTGNSYALDDGKSVLLLEAGLPAKKIFDGYLDVLDRVVGCLVTHEHADHAQAMPELTMRGIDVYASAGTLAEVSKIRSLRTHRVKCLIAGHQYTIGDWIVKPFDTQHDAKEPLGFLIYSKLTGEKILFATDTYYIKYRFLGLTVIMLECNYSTPIMLENCRLGRVQDLLKSRLYKSHLSLENVIKYLGSIDLSKVHDIYLLHCSEGNGDKKLFEAEVQKSTGIPVTVL